MQERRGWVFDLLSDFRGTTLIVFKGHVLRHATPPHLQLSPVRLVNDAPTASFSNAPRTPTPTTWIVIVVELTANPPESTTCSSLLGETAVQLAQT